MSKILVKEDDINGRKELSHILQNRSNAIIVGHLNDLWIKRFKLMKMIVIDKTYDMDDLKSKFKSGRTGCILVVEDINDIFSDIRELFSSVVCYEATTLPPCIEWCVEQYAYVMDPKVLKGSKTNTEFELACYNCNDYDLFSCIYDPEGMANIDEGIQASYTSCRSRCFIEHRDNLNKEHKVRGVCEEGKTWYEKYNSTFAEVEYETKIVKAMNPESGEEEDLEVQVAKTIKGATFKGKEIQ